MSPILAPAHVAGPASTPPNFAVERPRSGRSSIARSLSQGALGGTSISIVATPLAAAVGDFVIVQFAWSTGGNTLSTVTDVAGNTWTVVSTPGTNQSGGYGFTTVTTGWADFANNVTGTLASGTPGGRIWAAASIAAAYSPVLDQHTETATTTDRVQITTAGSLAQVQEVILIHDLVRGVSNAIPTWIWNSNFAGLNAITGSGTLSAGLALGSYDNIDGQGPVTGGFNDLTSSAGHGTSILAVQVTTTVNAAVNPPAGTAAASAPTPGIGVGVPPPAATASASAPTPTVAADSQVSPPAATASASAPTPGVALNIPTPTATASASAPVPTVSAGQTVSPPAATASASAPIPAISVNVTPPAATASASAPIPTVAVPVAVLPPTATASASAPIPTVTVFTPPPVQQLPGNKWEAYLCDRFGYPIQNITRVCFGKQLTQTLNQPSQFTFWAPSSDSRIAGLHTDGNPYLMEGRAIRVYRNGTLVFTGHLWQVEDTGDDVAVKTAVTCFDPLQWLTRRVARRMVYANLAIGSPAINLYVSLFTNKDDDVYTFQATNSHGSAETARGLLNAANDYDGFTGLDDFYLSSIYRPNVATPASCTNQSAPSTGNVNIAFANSRVSDVLSALVGQSGNFDLEVVPTDTDYYSSASAGPFHGGSRSATFQKAYKFGWAGDYTSIQGALLTKPWKTLALLKYWAPLKGSQQDTVVFGYGTYPHNVSGISRLIDLQNLTNNSVMLGSQNWAREVNITSVQTYGAGMDVQGLSDITDPVLLDALATEEVDLGGNARQTVQITPLPGARTPLPFDNFVLGDQVHVNAGSKLRGGFTGLQRVYGFTLDIADDHTTETLASLIASPQTN